jgi:hypothetical protein
MAVMAYGDPAVVMSATWHAAVPPLESVTVFPPEHETGWPEPVVAANVTEPVGRNPAGAPDPDTDAVAVPDPPDRSGSTTVRLTFDALFRIDSLSRPAEAAKFVSPEYVATTT